MASNECMYFYEDEVYRVTKKGNLEFGMVLQNADVDTDEEQSDSEEVEKLKNGHILVAWHPRGEEDVVNEKKVGLSDRCLMPGDVVRRLVPGQDTQRGYCRSITMKATVQVMGTRQVIYSVPSEELTPLEEFAPDIAVCMDAWVGIINSVTSDVSVQFVDGSVCVLTDEEAAELDDPAGGRLTDSGFRLWFYPGQKLQGPMRMFEPGRWTTCNTDAQALREKRNKHVKVTVTRYSVTSLSVHWQCRAATVEGSLDQPPYVVSGDDLKRVRMLNVFEPCTLQLGDMNTYRLRDTEILMSVDEWKRLEKDTLKTGRRTVRPAAKASRPGGAAAAAALPNGVADDDMGSVSSYSSVGSAGKRTRRGPSLKTHIMKKRKLKRSRPCRHPVYESRSFSAGDTLVVETMKTASWVTVVWQDGTVEEDIPSTSLYPSHHLDEHEFFPGDYVVEQKTEASPSEYGVIQRVDHAGRTSLVSWYRTYMLGGQSSPQLLRRSEASVYDLSDHPDFRYRPGTVVISVSAGAAGEPAVGGSTGAAEMVVGGSTNAESATTNSTGVVMAEQVCKTTEATALKTDEVGGKTEKRTGETAENEKSEIAKVAESAEVPGQGDGDKEERSEPTQTAAAPESAPSGCAHAGQVLDVLTSGEVKVWWADGSSSNCYPQDLFRVGEYDSDEGELWDNGAESQSTESAEWETQSEESMVAGDVSSDQEPVPDDRLKPKLAATIDKIRVLMTRLEQIFTQYSTVQSPFVMKQLLNIYKNSRCLDKLMDTAFFQESHFGGLVNQIRERSKAFAAQLGGAARLTDAGAPGDGSQNQDAASAAAATDDGPAMNECGQLCAKIKSQLLLAHEEVVRRYGIPLDTGLSYDSPAGEDSGINGDVRTDGEGNEEIDDDPTSPDEIKVTPSVDDTADPTDTRGQEMFTTLPGAPECHKFHNSPFQPVESPVFLKAVRREIKLLNKALPEGIIVKGFDDRMDLYSVMIKGPRRTPYEDGLFFFEIQLSPDYPRTPPMFHYISYCQDRLNPNLYEDGKVCVSLLGTWGGRGSEVWSAASSLMQVLVSIQGLILASEPYYNEAGYEKQRGSQQGAENSRLYNEMVILKLVQSLTAIMRNPPSVFVAEACEHLKARASSLIARLRHWLQASEAATQPATQAATQPATQAATQANAQTATQADTQTDTLPVAGETKPEFDRPDFPLIPASRGFGIALKKTLRTFEQTLAEHGVCEPAGGSLPAPSGTPSDTPSS